MLKVGQEVKIKNMSYPTAKKDGFITNALWNESYMVASDKTLPEHFSDLKTGEYHLCFWPEELEPIE